MSTSKEKFISSSEAAIKDKSRKEQLQKALSDYRVKNLSASSQFSDVELAKTRAGAIRQKVIENLD
ncbi:MAG: hypothetical protein ACK452_12890, partial [Bacteroidota bacterium]